MMPDTTPAPLAVPGREMARMLSISERSLWAVTAPRGPVPALRLNRIVRYVPADVFRALAAQQGGASNE